MILIKDDELSQENRDIKYINRLLDNQIKTLKKKNEKIELESQQLEYEIARLKALLNMDGTNCGILTSQTPINKEQVIPNTREKTNKLKGGQKGHPKYKKV